MKIHNFVMLTIGIAAIVLIVLVLVPKATTSERLGALERPAAQPAAQPKEVRESFYNGVYVQTIKHDGHTFVTAKTGSSYGGASIVHHPDCSCLRPKER